MAAPSDGEYWNHNTAYHPWLVDIAAQHRGNQRVDTLHSVKSKVAVTAATVLLVAALAAPAQASPPSYGSNGVFGVANNPGADGWVTAYIQPGHYRVDQAPSMFPYQSAPGFWYRCHSFPCSPSFPGNVIASGPAVRDAPTFIDILPTDAGVALNNVTLTVAG